MDGEHIAATMRLLLIRQQVSCSRPCCMYLTAYVNGLFRDVQIFNTMSITIKKKKAVLYCICNFGLLDIRKKSVNMIAPSVLLMFSFPDLKLAQRKFQGENIVFVIIVITFLLLSLLLIILQPI